MDSSPNQALGAQAQRVKELEVRISRVQSSADSVQRCALTLSRLSMRFNGTAPPTSAAVVPIKGNADEAQRSQIERLDEALENLGKALNDLSSMTDHIEKAI